MTVFDKWSKDPNQRQICAYATQQVHKSDDYQAGVRKGGGIAIAALAAAAHLYTHGEFTQADYLQAAEKATGTSKSITSPTAMMGLNTSLMSTPHSWRVANFTARQRMTNI